MCRALSVSKSGYVQWRHHGDVRRRLRDEELRLKIVSVHDRHDGRYGSPRVTQELAADGENVSRKRVARLMREMGIRGESPRKRVRTTDSNHSNPVADNILDRDFRATRPNQKWVTDITYVHTEEGWLYLSAIMDLFSRMIIGWSMDSTMEVSLIAKALDMALLNRRPDQNLIHHSDRGSQYASHHYRQLLDQAGITVSMSRRGNCHDNACAESFWARLKVECLYRRKFATRDEARAAIFEYIAAYYNRVRRHSGIGYQTPEAFELAYHHRMQKAS